MLWAESNLRGQIERSLPPGGPVTATTVIHSALRRTVERRARLSGGIAQAQAFLAGIALRVRSEKFRRELAQRRTPESGRMLSLFDHDTPGGGSGSASLWQVVAEMPRNLRELVDALYRERLTFREYADRVGIPEKQVERAHQRAIQYLRQAARMAEDLAAEELS